MIVSMTWQNEGGSCHDDATMFHPSRCTRKPDVSDGSHGRRLRNDRLLGIFEVSISAILLVCDSQSYSPGKLFLTQQRVAPDNRLLHFLGVVRKLHHAPRIRARRRLYSPGKWDFTFILDSIVFNIVSILEHTIQNVHVIFENSQGAKPATLCIWCTLPR